MSFDEEISKHVANLEKRIEALEQKSTSLDLAMQSHDNRMDRFVTCSGCDSEMHLVCPFCGNGAVGREVPEPKPAPEANRSLYCACPIRETLMCIYYDHGFCDYKKPDTGAHDEEAVTQMRMEERIESAERQIQKLDRSIWEAIKDKGSDGLAWEQDFLNATRRIEGLESRMSGVCEWQQIQEGRAMEIRHIDDERFEKLEILSLKADERIEALEKQHVDLTPQHHVADAVRKMDEMQNRIAALEVAGASLKLYLHSNGLWRRSSD